MIGLFYGGLVFVLLVTAAHQLHLSRQPLVSLNRQPNRQSNLQSEYIVRQIGILRRRRRNDSIVRALPITTSLLQVALQSGHNVRGALQVVAEHVDGAMGEELQIVSNQLTNGVSIRGALDQLVIRTSRHLRPLASTLSGVERYGAAVSEVLERLAKDSQRDQDQQAQRAAKKLSVQLLFPLAGCILPAFALLTVTPVLVSALGALTS